MINTAPSLAASKRFFHWELEFPEVFFDESKRKDDGGFDAVVGNPPYRVLIKSQVGNELLQYYNRVYKTSQYNPNLFALMIERAVNVSKLGGVASFIVPSLWLTNKYFSHLRRFLANNCHILQLTDLGFGVFDEVVETGLFFVKRALDREKYDIRLSSKTIASEQINILSQKISSDNLMKDIEQGFTFFNQGKSFNDMITKETQKLAESFIVYRGVETKDNEKYLAVEMISSDYKPILVALP